MKQIQESRRWSACKDSAWRAPDRRPVGPLMALCFFLFYWETACVLLSRSHGFYFGADANIYMDLAYGEISRQILFFHPLTALLASAWMKILSPFFTSLTPEELLGAMFAFIGALGVWAGYSALKTLVPHRYAIPWAVAYGISLSIWYFSSIHESKIVDASLSALYIAVYMHLRENFTVKGGLLITTILIAACLNAIVSAFLVMIPALDLLLRRGFLWCDIRWLFLHTLPVPIILLALETAMRLSGTGVADTAEGKDHVSLFLEFYQLSEHSASSLYGFILNWFLFSIAAPTPDTSYASSIWPDERAYFEPAVIGYLSSISTSLFIWMFLGMLVASTIAMRKEVIIDNISIFLALIIFSAMRGILFFAFIAAESLLYSPSVVLPHITVLAILFYSWRFSNKEYVLYFLIVLIFLGNMRFILI